MPKHMTVWKRLLIGCAAGLGMTAVLALAYDMGIAIGWILLGLWVLGTLASVVLVFKRARAEQRPPSVRLLFGRPRSRHRSRRAT
jgi:hypothetical protein